MRTYRWACIVSPYSSDGETYSPLLYSLLFSPQMHNWSKTTMVLCQEKVQVKSELFLQHSLFIQPVFPSYSISAHTHSRIHLVIDIHNDCGFLPYYKMSLCIQIPIYRQL